MPRQIPFNESPDFFRVKGFSKCIFRTHNFYLTFTYFNKEITGPSAIPEYILITNLINFKAISFEILCMQMGEE